MPKSTTSLTSLAMCFLLMIVGVPESISCDELLACYSTMSTSCTWRNDLDNRDAVWKITLEPSTAGLGHSVPSSYCLVPMRRRVAFPPGDSNSLVAEFHSIWVPRDATGSGIGGQMCLRFSYRLKDTFDSDNAKAAKLSLLKRVSGSCRVEKPKEQKFSVHLCRNEDVWASSTTNGAKPADDNVWKTVSIDLKYSSDFKLIFEGTIPANNPNARICVDNITAYHRPCHQIAASAYEASMRRWLEPIVFIFIGALAFALLIAVVIFAIRVNRRRGKKLSPGGSSGGSVDGSASPQRLTTGGRQHHHRRQQEAMLLHAERLADGPAASVVPIGHGHGPRRPAPPVPAAQPSLDELLLDSGHQAAAAAAAAACNDPPPRYEEAMGLVGAASSATAGQQQQQQPPPHPPRLNRGNGAFVV